MEELAEQVLRRCEELGVLIATAESCTGGMIIALLTGIPGSSTVVDRGFITYSNKAKVDMLGVDEDILESHGAVSREIALAMAVGALRNSRATLALSVTGIAGPAGGSPEKPVGLVWFGVAFEGREPHVEKRQFEDRGRDQIRRDSVKTALELAWESLKGSG